MTLIIICCHKSIEYWQKQSQKSILHNAQKQNLIINTHDFKIHSHSRKLPLQHGSIHHNLIKQM